MSTRKLQLNVSGFTDGLNTEASALNVLPSEFMEGTINVELLHNGSARRRRGVDFIGSLETMRSGTTTSELYQESPSAIFVRLPAPNGTLVERVIVDFDNKFFIFLVSHDGMVDFSTPYQTITRGDRSAANQIYYNMQFAQSGEKVFFAGRYCQPGYLKIDTDNVTMAVSYFDVKIRDITATTVGAALITRYSKTEVMDNTKTRPTTVDFYAGRVWLGGDPRYPDIVYFSQVVAQDSDLEKYYQEADPFDPNDPNLVDDDGGYIKIAGAGTAYRLIAANTALFAGTSLGIWQISGAAGSPFKATDFSVNKVLTDRILGPENMVRAGTEMVVFGANTIWSSRIERSLSMSTAGIASFVALNTKKNKSLWNDISDSGKASGRAVYSDRDSRVYYFYNGEQNSYSLSYTKDNQPGYARNVLVFDVSFDDELVRLKEDVKRRVDGAFFVYELDDTAAAGEPYVACAFIAPSVRTGAQVVLATGDVEVVTSGGESVLAAGSGIQSDNITMIALRRATSGSDVTISAAFAEFNEDKVVDWASDEAHSASYVSRIISGVQTGGDVLHRKGATYLYFVFKKVETGEVDADGIDSNPGGCFVRTAWQWSTSTTSARYSAPAQVYIPDRFNQAIIGGGDDGHSHTWFKHRVRGSGNALQVILESEDDKDFHLIGWSQQFWGKQD